MSEHYKPKPARALERVNVMLDAEDLAWLDQAGGVMSATGGEKLNRSELLRGFVTAARLSALDVDGVASEGEFAVRVLRLFMPERCAGGVRGSV
jgi:hypothetical protein